MEPYHPHPEHQFQRRAGPRKRRDRTEADRTAEREKIREVSCQRLAAAGKDSSMGTGPFLWQEESHARTDLVLRRRLSGFRRPLDKEKTSGPHGPSPPCEGRGTGQARSPAPVGRTGLLALLAGKKRKSGQANFLDGTKGCQLLLALLYICI